MFAEHLHRRPSTVSHWFRSLTFCQESILYQTLYIHLLHQTDIHIADYSMFFSSDCLAIYAAACVPHLFVAIRVLTHSHLVVSDGPIRAEHRPSPSFSNCGPWIRVGRGWPSYGATLSPKSTAAFSRPPMAVCTECGVKSKCQYPKSETSVLARCTLWIPSTSISRATCVWAMPCVGEPRLSRRALGRVTGTNRSRSRIFIHSTCWT